MPLKNKLTLAAFIAKFSSEKACHEYLAKIGTTRPANGFRFTKLSRPTLPGGSGVVSKLHQEQRPELCLDRYGFRILCGAPNPEQVAWGIFRFR